MIIIINSNVLCHGSRDVTRTSRSLHTCVYSSEPVMGAPRKVRTLLKKRIVELRVWLQPDNIRLSRPLSREQHKPQLAIDAGWTVQIFIVKTTRTDFVAKTLKCMVPKMELLWSCSSSLRCDRAACAAQVCDGTGM